MKRTILVVGMAALALTACSSKKNANEKNFTAAIQQQLEKSSADLCIPFTSSRDVPLNSWDMKQLQPFEAAGLISGTEVEINDPMALPNPYATTPAPKLKIERYTLTEAGKKFYHEMDVSNPVRIVYATQNHFKRGYLCYGKIAVDKVTKWTEPTQSDNSQTAQVSYLYKIDNLADWAKKPEIQQVEPTLRSMLEGVSKTELTQAVVLTNLGWEAVSSK